MTPVDMRKVTFPLRASALIEWSIVALCAGARWMIYLHMLKCFLAAAVNEFTSRILTAASRCL